ncbi:hypothetical protein PX554_10430 [Sphingomonas sp. H39-1-10]|uniref:hypothetical protein n=1 Tax=Sphingomonas TaxID=13687 RepID=UPI00088C94EB|nr:MULTISPECIES: hypothetical protein [Sphingomonas]MDF0488545.1 hypothetical protein [Sphingomonas pollutisoli]SDA11785.1 hypothetical protein SAMN03159340_00185 [Sphingomonas sp. NFR15]
MSKTLAGFTITRSGEEYLISMEDEDGEKTEFVASYEQLDLIVEAIEEQLDGDEEDALGVDDEAEPA